MTDRTALGVAGMLLLFAVSVSTRQPKPPIIDMHMHARMGPIMVGGKAAPRPCMPAPCEGIPSAATAPGDPLRLTLEAMHRHNIVLGFLSDPLDNVFKWIEAAPKKFIVAPTVFDPQRADLARLRREYQSGRLKGMGELASQYHGIPPNDERLRPFFGLAEEFDVPALIHTEGIAGESSQFRIAHGHPQLLEDVLARHPKLRLYLENAGYPFLDETIALLYRYPRVYVDVSTITWIIPRPAFHRALSQLIDAGLEDRIMFGSDQMNWPETIDAAVEAIENAPMLTPRQRRKIFYENAVRFLRLKN